MKDKHYPFYITEAHAPNYDQTDERATFDEVIAEVNATYDVDCKTQKDVDEFIAFFNENNLGEEVYCYTKIDNLEEYKAFCEETGWNMSYE